MKAVTLSLDRARRIWLAAQRLDTPEPFGAGPDATRRAVEHLGYVQIDTINVIERSHHHILYSRIPGYRRADLRQAQSVDKTLFEYWTHALAYVPVRDLPFFVPDMKAHRAEPGQWAATVPDEEVNRIMRMIRQDGAVSIRDIEDDVLIDKTHPWASRKPSKGALQRGFYDGRLAISERLGMLKTYEVMERHFGWDRMPRPATPKQVNQYVLDRALRSQGLVSLDSICHLDAPRKAPVRALIETALRKKLLVPVDVEGAGKTEHWTTPEWLALNLAPGGQTHILSPFDPLIIQRKRLKLFFGYEHIFEAYIPRAKRKFGYFTLPVLYGDQIVAALDLKTDRAAQKLLIQSWHWVGEGNAKRHKASIEAELARFERFQLSVD